MKITQKYTNYAILLILIIIFSIMFFYKKNIIENNLSCTTFITVESKKPSNESMMKLMYRMMFDGAGNGIASFDGDYTDTQGVKTKIARYFKFKYRTNGKNLFISDSEFIKNITDTAPDNIIPFSKTEVFQVNKFTPTSVIMESVSPTFVCNLISK